MANGASNIIHIAAARIRVVGEGNLDLDLFGYDDVLTQSLSPMVMSLTNAREQRSLANFISQSTRLKFGVNAINEHFKVNSIVIFIKEQWSEYPG